MSNEKKEEPTEKQYIYDTYFYEAEVISHRTDWFLIFHVILLEAFFASNNGYFVWAIIVLLGILISYIWLMSGIRGHRAVAQIGRLMGKEKIMEDVAKRHKRIFKYRKMFLNNQFYGWASPSPSFGVVLPALWLLAWEGIAWHYLGGCFNFISISAMVVVTIVIILIGPGVKKDADSKKTRKVTKL